MDAEFGIAGVAPGEAFELASVLDDVDPDALEDVDPEGGVEGAMLDEDDEDGGVLGVIDELEDDVEPVRGVDGIDDDDEEDGDGVTVGGVVVVDVFDSRWHPATPSARPVQSSVTKVTLLMSISRTVEGRALKF